MERNSEVMENRLIDAATVTAKSSTMIVKMAALLLSVSVVNTMDPPVLHCAVKPLGGYLSACCMAASQAGAISCRFYDLANGIYDELGLFDLDVVPAILRDDLLRIV